MMDMKTMKNIFNILLLGLMVTTVCSCNDEIEYSPGEPSPFAESKVFFSKDNAYDLILGVYDTEVTFFLERTDASSALSVPLEASVLLKPLRTEACSIYAQKTALDSSLPTESSII